MFIDCLDVLFLKCLFKFLAHFSVFFLLTYGRSFYILDVKYLSVIQFTNIFSHSVACLFNFPNGVFDV